MSGADLAQLFLAEAADILDQLEQMLLDLERAPQNLELVDAVFRALHTIKGSGAMFGFTAVASFTHHVENAFDGLRTGRFSPSPELIAVTLAAKDQIRLLIEQPGNARDDVSEAILARLQGLVATPSVLVPLAAKAWSVRFTLPSDAMATGTNPLVLLDELRSLGGAEVQAFTHDVPSLDEIDPVSCYLHWDVTLVTEKTRDDIEQVFIFLMDGLTLDIAPIDIHQDTNESEIAGSGLPQQRPVSEDVQPTAAAQAARTAQAETPKPPKLSKSGDSVRVPAERLDEMMDRVGELVIAQSRLSQVAAASGDAAVKSVSEELGRLSLELRDTTMGIRMMPIGSLFGRFRRLAHDLAQELGKDIEFITSGEETELDKTVIERLNEPLIHLIRNAMDHGLETPEGRRAAGKNRQGRLSLTAKHSGAEVQVCIAEDGHGLDRERIQARAEQNGLLQPGTTLPDAQLFQLIFQPGFSTAAVVTKLSGRGVGMDVVKRTIDGLRGTIDVTSTPGAGTQVTLRLPLTLAIIDGLLIKVGDARYVLPLSSVEECVELTTAEDARSRGMSILNIRGNLVPFLRLRDVLGATGIPDPYQKVVVVSSNDRRIGLVVDQVIGDHQTVIKSLPRLHAGVRTFSGATIMGDGLVALILDIAHLIDYGQRHEERFRMAS